MREPGLCQASCSVAPWEGGEARKHCVPRAGCKAVVLETAAWKFQGRPGSTGKAAGRKVITVRKQVLDAGRGSNPVHKRARTRPPRPAHSLVPLVFNIAAQRVFFQRARPARALRTPSEDTLSLRWSLPDARLGPQSSLETPSGRCVRSPIWASSDTSAGCGRAEALSSMCPPASASETGGLGATPGRRGPSGH